MRYEKHTALDVFIFSRERKQIDTLRQSAFIEFWSRWKLTVARKMLQREIYNAREDVAVAFRREAETGRAPDIRRLGRLHFRAI